MQYASSMGIMKLKRILTSASLAAVILVAAAPWISTAQAEDCYAIGMRLAADNGGQLARATPAIRDGKQVCRIVILVPGRDGSRPRRAEYVVPAE
jgi:hypothetical protein